MASSQMHAVISQTEFPGLKLHGRGKVRDIYDLGDRLLIVATDRLSAFDVVLPTPIPDKGRVLTQLSLFWFEKLADVVPNHVIPADNFSDELAPYRGCASRPRDACSANRAGSHRMCRARLHLRFGLEGLSKDGRHLRHSTACRPARIGPPARTDLYTFNQGHQRPRREYFI